MRLRAVMIVLASIAVLGAVCGTSFCHGIFPGREGFALPDDLSGTGVLWAPDGEDLLLLGMGPRGEGVVELRSPSGQLRWRARGFVLPAPLWRCAAFFPDGGWVAVGDTEGLHLIRADTGEGSVPIPVEGDIAWLGYAADGRLAVAVVQEEVLYLEWRDPGGALLSREEIAPWAAPAYHLATKLSLTPEGRFLLYPEGEPDLWYGYWVVNLLDREARETRTWDLREPLPWLEEAGYIEALALRPDGGEIAVALRLRETEHPVLFRLDVLSGEVVEVPLPGGAERFSVDAVAYSPDGRILAAALADGLYLVQPEGVRKLGDGAGIRALAFSPDGKYLAAITEDAVPVFPSGP